jgi:chaperone LolA
MIPFVRIVPRGAALPASAAIVLLTANLPAQSADSLLARASRTYAGVRTLTGTIEQHLVYLSGNVYDSRAELQQQLPNRLSLRFTDPRGDLIVADGSLVWAYTPSTDAKRATMAPISSIGVWVDLINVLVQEPRTKYNITHAGRETMVGRSTHALTLVPKERGGDFVRATIWIEEDTGVIRQFRIEEQSGLQRQVRFTALILNAPVDAALFRFTPPSGVKVDTVGVAR